MTKKINDQNKNKKTIARSRLAFVLNFEFLNFEFVSNFVLRASDFIFTRRLEYSLNLATFSPIPYSFVVRPIILIKRSLLAYF
jgi:hypothetical protein